MYYRVVYIRLHAHIFLYYSLDCLCLQASLHVPPLIPPDASHSARLRLKSRLQEQKSKEVLARDGKPHHPCRVKLHGVERSQEVHDSLGPGHDLLAGATSPPDSTIQAGTGRVETHKHRRRDTRQRSGSPVQPGRLILSRYYHLQRSRLPSHPGLVLWQSGPFLRLYLAAG